MHCVVLPAQVAMLSNELEPFKATDCFDQLLLVHRSLFLFALFLVVCYIEKIGHLIQVPGFSWKGADIVGVEVLVTPLLWLHYIHL